jgi:photosystem II stability/assembly factor-like uncharacterized protein
MYKRIISFTVVWISIMVGIIWAQDLVWEDISRGNHDVQAILVTPWNGKIIFAGSSGSILKSDDAGKNWRVVLTIRSALRNINALAMNPSNYNVIYAATDNGLYRSNDLGGRWERVFRGKNNLEAQCTAVFNVSDLVFVGTKAGFFISRDNGHSWSKEDGKIGKNVILNIDSNFKQPATVYLAATNGIFKSLDSGKNWEKIFAQYRRENNIEETISGDSIEPDKALGIRFVKIDINNINRVYFSCANGVYQSLNQGQSWEKLTEHGLLNRDVHRIFVSDSSEVFALSQSGVFSYEGERWKEISLTMAAGKLNSLSLDNAGHIYISGEKGIFKAISRTKTGFISQALLQDYLKSEPKIRDVQEAAIKYAEVSSEKIAQWRKQSAKKALLPQLSIGLDRNTTDLWHWEGGSTTKSDDDALRRGKDNIDWDVSLSWDLSDLIWNDAQTSIDVRSKLMVELRGDILDQVNKLYFERLRVKSELDNLTIEDRNKRFDKQLKLEELTASLDSLTCGYYSEQLCKLAPKEQS